MKASSVPVEKHLLVEPWASQPWPQLREDGERARDVVHPIESPGRAFYEARAAYRIAEDVGLTITYNRMKDPAVTDATVENLRALTLAMDRAVLAAYGWDDLEPPPFTTPATADEKRAVAGFEDAVIDRLFALNAERARAQGTAGGGTRDEASPVRARSAKAGRGKRKPSV
jgi:hypothetical protein